MEYDKLGNRELDKLVAEKIFKREVEENYTSNDYMEAYKSEIHNGETMPQGWSTLRYFSIDIQAAWQIVKEMKNKNFEIILEDYSSFTPNTWKVRFEPINMETHSRHVDKTAPRAICICALKAMDEEDKK